MKTDQFIEQYLKFVKRNENRFSFAIGMVILTVAGALILTQARRMTESRRSPVYQFSDTETLQPSPSPEQKTRIHRTTSADTLWKLAIAYYGDGNKWTVIYEANKQSIPNPDRLEKDVDLVIPE
jgi:nucleoid-associated protein YgaU